MNKDFIRSCERAGWRVFGLMRGELHLKCRHLGCQGFITLSPAEVEAGAIPAACDLEHVRHSHFRSVSPATISDVRDVVAVLKGRRERMGLTIEETEAVVGLASGHLAKIESGIRTTPQIDIITAWASALGYSVALTPDTLPDATMRALEAKAGRRAYKGAA